MTEFELQGEKLELLPAKAIYWPAQKALLLADTHFGKVTHFRKAGIALPEKAAINNLQKFHRLVADVQPRRVLFLGDLFHSDLNTEWLHFKETIRSFPEILFELIAGNHDILHDISYQNLNFSVHKNGLALGPFFLSHEPETHALYNLCGHIHPGVRLTGIGRQSMRVPTFYFSQSQGILPAFGEFTGLHLLKAKKEDTIFIVSGQEVMRING